MSLLLKKRVLKCHELSRRRAVKEEGSSSTPRRRIMRWLLLSQTVEVSSKQAEILPIELVDPNPAVVE